MIEGPRPPGNVYLAGKENPVMASGLAHTRRLSHPPPSVPRHGRVHGAAPGRWIRDGAKRR